MSSSVFTGLYPTVGISDMFNVIAHLVAARICFEANFYFAALGFITVAAAGLKRYKWWIYVFFLCIVFVCLYYVCMYVGR